MAGLWAPAPALKHGGVTGNGTTIAPTNFLMVAAIVSRAAAGTVLYWLPVCPDLMIKAGRSGEGVRADITVRRRVSIARGTLLRAIAARTERPGERRLMSCARDRHQRAGAILDRPQRLALARRHRVQCERRVKGADLSYEDEKFSYVALAREPLARERPPGFSARVLAHPRVGKAEVSAKLCTPAGIVTTTAAHREPERYKAQKAWRWGNAVNCPNSRASHHTGSGRLISMPLASACAGLITTLRSMRAT
jgi:hypothetical protein